MMSALEEGRGVMEKWREVAWIIWYTSVPNADNGGGGQKTRKFCGFDYGSFQTGLQGEIVEQRRSQLVVAKDIFERVELGVVVVGVVHGVEVGGQVEHAIGSLLLKSRCRAAQVYMGHNFLVASKYDVRIGGRGGSWT